MTIILRCIIHKAVTPPCYILCLDHDEWRTFLYATPQERKRMALTKLNKTYLIGATREMVWIPYEGQNKIKPKSVVRLKECPNCGCPVSECEKVSLDETSTSISFFKTDWAHKLYECGAIFWDTLTKRYSKFNGRASRLEYWSFVFVSWWFIATTWGLGAIVVLIPALAVGVRRCHDINRSGWWILVPWVSVFFQFKKSDEGENDYGSPDIINI